MQLVVAAVLQQKQIQLVVFEVGQPQVPLVLEVVLWAQMPQRALVVVVL